MIIDSHLHLSLTNKKGNFEIATQRLEAVLKENKITKAIIIADNIPGSYCADLGILLKYYQGNPNIFLVGALNIFNHSLADIKNLDNLLSMRKIVGLKLFPGHDKFYPTDKRCNPVYRLCLKYNCPVIIHTGINTKDIDCAKYNDPKHIIKIAQKYSGLKIIISHYFWPKLDYCYEMTKDSRNIYFDTSSLADKEIIKKSGGLNKIKGILTKTVLEKPNNVLFGTDYPICSIKDHIKLIKSLNIQKPLKNKIFSGNALSVFLL